MLGSLITFENCRYCRKCCIFTERELAEAPLFVENIKRKIQLEFSQDSLVFEPMGELWQIRLNPIKHTKRWICPLYDQDSARCRVQHYKPLNCAFYPFYIMRQDKRLVIALSNVCPVVNEQGIESLLEYLKRDLAQIMVSKARKYPDLVIDYREEATILVEVKESDPLDCLHA